MTSPSTRSIASSASTADQNVADRSAADQSAADESTARRARRNLNTREALCRSAVKLFGEHGYAGTPAGAIANDADYAERTFFRHFARKEDVIFYDLPERLAALKADFAAAEGDRAWTIIRSAFVANAARWESTDHDLTLGRVRLFHTEPALEARYLDICRDWEDAVAEILAGELGVDPVSDLRCRLVSAATVGAFRAAFRAWLADPATHIADHLATGLDYIETGLLPN